MMAPTKKTKFQIWVFQLKLKKLAFLPKPTAAQMVLKLEENPNDWPKYIRKNMMAAIMVPENHHDHVCVINSIISSVVLI